MPATCCMETAVMPASSASAMPAAAMRGTVRVGRVATRPWSPSSQSNSVPRNLALSVTYGPLLSSPGVSTVHRSVRQTRMCPRDTDHGGARMVIRTHVGVSLDGYVADADGVAAWESLPSYEHRSHGIAEVLEHCEAVVMGRETFDRGLARWARDWPWTDKQVHVLTSRPLPDTVNARACDNPAELLRRLQLTGLMGDVHLLGGPRTIRAFLD